MSGLDPITLTVIQSGLQQVCNEMDLAFVRSAFSPVISEALDRSDGIYEKDSGELIAQGELGLPVFVGTMQFGTQCVIERAKDLKEGDLFIVDPSMLHAATPNTRRDITPEYRRYVLFSTFFDKRTTDHLLPPRGSSGPAIKFAPDMREALPQQLQSLFDWTAPSPEDAEAVVRERIARL